MQSNDHFNLVLEAATEDFRSQLVVQIRIGLLAEGADDIIVEFESIGGKGVPKKKWCERRLK